MATKDAFLDLLETPMGRMEAQRRVQESINRQAAELQKATNPPIVNPPIVNPPIVNPPIVNPPIVNPPIVNPPIDRPDWAGDIDRIVETLVHDGDVVFDAANDCYRAPWCRRFRFGG